MIFCHSCVKQGQNLNSMIKTNEQRDSGFLLMIHSISDLNQFKMLLQSIILDYLHQFPEKVDDEEREDLKIFLQSIINW